MALLFIGKTICPICGLVIDDEQDAYGFPAFGENPQDLLYRFSDGAFHETCLLGDVDGRKAVEVIRDRASKIGPGKRKCQVCGEEIMDPDDYAMIDYICAPEVHSIASFHYTHLHRSHSVSWNRKEQFLKQLENAWKAGILSQKVAEALVVHLGLPVPPKWLGSD